MLGINFSTALKIISDYDRNEIDFITGREHRCDHCAELFKVDKVFLSLEVSRYATEFDIHADERYKGYKAYYRLKCPHCCTENTILTRTFKHSRLKEMKGLIERGIRRKVEKAYILNLLR